MCHLFLIERVYKLDMIKNMYKDEKIKKLKKESLCVPKRATVIEQPRMMKGRRRNRRRGERASSILIHALFLSPSSIIGSLLWNRNKMIQ